MRYLVIGEMKRTAPMPPEQFLKQAIASMQALAAQEKAGKVVAGGVFAGRPGGFGVVEAETHEEVDRFCTSLPFWALLDWEIIPLISYESAVERDQGILARLSAQKK